MSLPIVSLVAPGSPEIRWLWAVIDTDNLDLAKSQLIVRKGKERKDWVTAWAEDKPAPDAMLALLGSAAPSSP